MRNQRRTDYFWLWKSGRGSWKRWSLSGTLRTGEALRWVGRDSTCTRESGGSTGLRSVRNAGLRSVSVGLEPHFDPDVAERSCTRD